MKTNAGHFVAAVIDSKGHAHHCRHQHTTRAQAERCAEQIRKVDAHAAHKTGTAPVTVEVQEVL